VGSYLFVEKRGQGKCGSRGRGVKRKVSRAVKIFREIGMATVKRGSRKGSGKVQTDLKSGVLGHP